MDNASSNGISISHNNIRFTPATLAFGLLLPHQRVRLGTVRWDHYSAIGGGWVAKTPARNLKRNNYPTAKCSLVSQAARRAGGAAWLMDVDGEASMSMEVMRADAEGSVGTR